MDIVKFDPSVEELNKIVAATSAITATDLSDDTQLALVHDTRISLRDARVKIEKTGKALRADALKFQKDVIQREKELIGIIEPEESRLGLLEEAANTQKERAARAALLPMRREALATIGIDTAAADEYRLLDLDNDEFIALLNDLTAKKNEADRLEIQAEKDRLAHEAFLSQVKKDAEIAERKRIEDAAKLDEERRVQAAAQAKFDAERAAQQVKDEAAAESARIVQEARDKVEQEKAQAEAAAREKAIRAQQVADEAAKAEQQAAFTAWKIEKGCTDENIDEFEVKHTPAGIELWKRVGIYTI
jgi:hypothetical protein